MSDWVVSFIGLIYGWFKDVYKLLTGQLSDNNTKK